MADKQLTIERSIADFQKAYRAKSKLIARQKEDFLFRLGKQWDDDKKEKLKAMNIEAITDNRIQPNIFLLTGLERQNRSDFKAFPEGEEDSVKAEIASALFKNAIKQSDFGYKASESFEDGVTCGESYLELYLDYTYNLSNAKPCWKKIDSNCVFPEPGFKEYDFSDARYVYKLTVDLSREDLMSLFPDCKSKIEEATHGKLDIQSLLGAETNHSQKKDYPKHGGSDAIGDDAQECGFDLLERYYKKWIEKHYVGDRQTGEIKEAESKQSAEGFVSEYKARIAQEQEAFALAQQQAVEASDLTGTPARMPMAPPAQDPGRFVVIKRLVPEIWYFAHTPGIASPLADEVAWFYPNWKHWSLIPYFAHFSTAPIDGDDRHLLVQGIVHGVKGAQKKHNSSETLMLMHLNGAANSGWLSEEEAWLNPAKVAELGSTPNVNLVYKKGAQKPERIFPMALSQGHHVLSQESAEAIKAQLGINADLLAVQEGGQSSGRAIALRQRQGLLMVQKLFDNLSRTKQIAGKFLLTQLGDIYDTETAKKVLGEAFLTKNFPPPMVLDESGAVDPVSMQPQQVPMPDPKTGQPMTYDVEMSELAIAEVLSGDLGQYDVAVGESVASETMKLANAAELQELAAKMPGLIPPDLLVEESQLNQATKNRVLGSIKQAQAAAVPRPGMMPPIAV